MYHRSMHRRWVILGLAVGLVLTFVTPAAAARKATPGWDTVSFAGNWMWYEAGLGPGIGEEIDSLHVQAYDGQFRFGRKGEARSARVLVAQAGGGDCIATDSGHVIIGWHVIGSDEVGTDIAFESPRAGSLDVTLTMTGTRAIWEAEYLGPGNCEGIQVLEEEPIEKEISIELNWTSEATVILVTKGKKTREETRWVTTTTTVSGTLDGSDLKLPFGEGEPDRYWSQSCPLSGSITIPTGTFD